MLNTHKWLVTYLFKKQFLNLSPSFAVNGLFKKEESKIRGKYLSYINILFKMRSEDDVLIMYPIHISCLN